MAKVEGSRGIRSPRRPAEQVIHASTSHASFGGREMPRTGALPHHATPQRDVPPTYASPFARELMGFVISYPPDAEIYGEEEQAEYFYKVVNGSVRTYKTLKNGRRQIAAFYVPGDVFGLETRGEHTLSADAVAESSLLLINRSALVALAEQDKDAAGRLWTLTAAELRRNSGSHPAFCIAGAGACRRLSCRDGAAPRRQ